MSKKIRTLKLGDNAFFVKYRYETRNGNWQTLHAHPGIELLFIHEGSGTVTLGSQQYKLEKNKLFCFQPYQLHKVDVPVSEGLSYIRTNVTFDPSILEPYLQPFPQLQSFVRFLAKGSLKSHVFTISQAQSLEHMYSNFDKVRNVTGEEPNLECRVLFLLSLLKYLQINVFGLDEAPPFLEKNSVHVERIMDWVELNFRKPFSLEAIAQELHLSPYHISHLFKQHAGMTLSEYLTGRRIREACVLLENTDISISEIGRHIGGFSAPYFSKLFKKHKGVTPNSYRHAVRKQLY